MPLRDHYRPPVSQRRSWEGFHGGWPMTMVQQLTRVLLEGFAAEPRAHLGTFYEIDVSTYDEDGDTKPRPSFGDSSNGGVATATLAPPQPTLTIQGDIPDEYAYEVLVHDDERDRHLVAAVEMVSPANKDRPGSRQIFVAKCASLLSKGVCVSMVDPVTIRRFNLYTELLTLIGYSDPAFAPHRRRFTRSLAASGRWAASRSSRLGRTRSPSVSRYPHCPSV